MLHKVCLCLVALLVTSCLANASPPVRQNVHDDIPSLSSPIEVINETPARGEVKLHSDGNTVAKLSIESHTLPTPKMKTAPRPVTTSASTNTMLEARRLEMARLFQPRQGRFSRSSPSRGSGMMMIQQRGASC
jgi:hypothetical protein